MQYGIEFQKNGVWTKKSSFQFDTISVDDASFTYLFLMLLNLGTAYLLPLRDCH